MPKFQITVTNDRFESVVEQDEKDMAAAKESALKGTLEVGAEMVLAGQPVFGAKVVVTDGDRRERFLVTVAAAPLL